MRISGLVLYPVKGLAGLELEESEVEPRGLVGDRRWMLVDEEGRFLSQRTTPRMCLFKIEQAGHDFTVCSPEGDSISFGKGFGETVSVNVWDDECRAATVSSAANEWFSRQLDRVCRLVYMPDEVFRAANPKYTQAGDRVGFADAFPILVASQESLNSLNSRLETPLPMNRFRPNLVISGCEAFAEDTWTGFEVGGTRFRAAKHCVRCQVTATNQETGEVGQEPLRTLATFRREGNGVIFGSYFVPESAGRLSLADLIVPS